MIVTGFYAAILALANMYLILNVVRLRRQERISIGDGGNESLSRAMRVHGNFIETVPLALILIGLTELNGAHFLIVHFLGSLLLLGRASHVYGMRSASAPGKFRFYGMVMTINVYVIGAIICFYYALMTAFA